MLATIDHRTKQISELRKEFRSDITTTNDRLFAMSENMADVRVELSGLAGAVNTLVPLVQQSLGGALQNHTVKFAAQVDLGTAVQRDIIEQKKWSREMWAKVLGLFGTGGLAATLIIMFAAGKC